MTIKNKHAKLKMSKLEKQLIKATKNTPVTEFKNAKELADWIRETDD